MKYVNLMRDLVDGGRECEAEPGWDQHTTFHGNGRMIIKGYSM